MSSMREKISAEGSDPQENDSVYDFLYQDVKRLASFLGQFDKYGHLTALVRTSSVSESSGSNYSVSGGIGLHAVANIGANGNQSGSQSGSDQSAMTYDPLWQNSLALLDYLEQRGLLCRNLDGVEIGQFALVTGKLIVMDLAMVRAIIASKRGSEIVAKAVVGESTGDKSKRERQTELAQATEMVQAMLASVPSAISMHLIGEKFGVWSSLAIGGLAVTVDDLLLKHGATPSGNWNVLGIVDALPDPPEPIAGAYFDEDSATKGIADLFTNLRPKMGRPAKSYGMTPLLIFREVVAPQPKDQTGRR